MCITPYLRLGVRGVSCEQGEQALALQRWWVPLNLPTNVVPPGIYGTMCIWRHVYAAPCVYGAMRIWHHAYTVPCVYGTMHIWCHAYMVPCIYGTMHIQRHVYGTMCIRRHVYVTMHIRHHVYMAPCVYTALGERRGANEPPGESFTA